MRLIIKYNLNLVIAIIFCVSLACCQVKNVVPVADVASLSRDYMIQGSFSNMNVDKLGNIYLINEKNEILKYDDSYNLLFRNSYNTQGRISHIDVSNPQKILVYFSDFQKILFLDNTLSEIKFLNLESLGYWNIRAVAPSVDNMIWIYDPINFKMIKINDNGNILLSSNELYSEGLQGASEPQIIARDDRVYLYTNVEVMVFNIFGELLKRINLPNNGIQYLQSDMLFSQDKKLKLRNMKTEFLTDSDREVHQYVSEISSFYLDKNNRLFSLDSLGLFVISI